jgi:hypothetical protein
LLSAPTGKAAYNIEGQTTFTAFFLPINKSEYCSLNNYPSILNTFRVKYKNLKLLIIDEISMVGSRQFRFIDMRLREIFAINKPFGGISVIVVGYLNQLQPVLDDWIFKPAKNNLADLLGYIWVIYKCVELKENMRRKDKLFSVALTNLSNGEMSIDEINLFKARQLNKISNKVPHDAVRLFYDKVSVKTYNTYKV